MHMKASEPSGRFALLYFCHIDWSWIKQRPQFLAEELGKSYRVHVAYPWCNRRKDMVRNARIPERCTRIFTLPAPGILKRCFQSLNNALKKIQIHRLFQKVKPDIVWIPHPDYLEFVPEKYTGRIVYDCMDDYVFIEPDPARRATLIAQENALIKRAERVFISSQTLADKLAARVPSLSGKQVLLRNGYYAQWRQREALQRRPKGRIRIGYFGTIGRWFDSDTLLMTLRENPNIEYHLYGPIERGTRFIAEDARIHYHGVLEHEMIPETADSLDALIMPFLRCEIVDSVDPIKLYEYICLGKPIFCIRYPEIERFEHFVLFYTTAEELSALIGQMETQSVLRYTTKEAECFLKENSWEHRGKTVINNLCASGR